MEEKKNYKKIGIIILVSLLIGFILGFLVFSNTDGSLFTKSYKGDLEKEIFVLNKEINNCIDQLNDCLLEDENFNQNLN